MYPGDVCAVNAVLVFAIKVHPFAIIHGVAENLAGIDFQAMKPGWRFLLKARGGHRFTTYFARQYLADARCIYSITFVIYWAGGI
jgi:hypothetical protein